jgi:hypothetical protein
MPSKKPQTTIADRDLRVLVIQDVEYFIYWDELAKGSSFFIPTTVQARDVARILSDYAEVLGMDFEIRNRCEYGRYGVRVWRT